ncbi:hypothetical protein K443DRAFT_677187 [Laccaria amethystina LaAM-08-1]|uniref:Uncharacterized protein n=1 Tax=Laccaria amethystina LaAM-08-1 TaxID=1095629 RepID=A0A0C9XYS0_9AGAR|nr:hypothetical protein K443DRAFT_677187 [Laccaria amethystina LaAM-08-1]
MNPHIYNGYPKCDHEHHLYVSPNTNPHANSDASPNVTMNQTRTPPERENHDHDHAHEASHDTSTRLPTRCADNVHHGSLSARRCRGLSIG